MHKDTKTLAFWETAASRWGTDWEVYCCFGDFPEGRFSLMGTLKSYPFLRNILSYRQKSAKKPGQFGKIYVRRVFFACELTLFPGNGIKNAVCFCEK